MQGGVDCWRGMSGKRRGMRIRFCNDVFGNEFRDEDDVVSGKVYKYFCNLIYLHVVARGLHHSVTHDFRTTVPCDNKLINIY